MSGLRRDRPAIMKRASEEEGNDGTIRFCPHCGTANNGGDFCANCGAPLTAPDAGSLQDMQTVPIPVLTTPQGYLDQDAGRSICRKWLRIFRRMSLIDVGFRRKRSR